MAVLPTPASPMSTGLFLVRRESTWMTRRISLSRPITGSSLPARAISVRSLPYFSRGWNFSSGAWSVTRWDPRRSARALRIASGVSPWALSSFARVAALVRGQGPEQVLGGDVVVLHQSGLLQGLVQDLIQTRGEVDLGLAAHPGQPGQQVIHPLDELLGIDFQFLQEGPDEPLLLGQEGAEQVGRLQLVVAQLPGQLLGPLQGLLGLIG